MAKLRSPSRKEKLSRHLKAARAIKGYTQERTAELIGVSKSVYGDWERNPDMIQFGKLRLVCLALDVDIVELVSIK